MKKRFSALLVSAALMMTGSGCSDNGGSSSSKTDTTESTTSSAEEATEAETTEPMTEHISPVETVTAQQSVQVTVDKTIQRTEGSNTIQLPLADFIEEGDVVSSFTFVIYSADGSSNIGEFKGGCGIAVTADCPSATDEYWYQSEDFAAPTQGSYGEIVWNVPGNVGSYVSAGGDVLFGYWWGNTESIRLESVICNFTRTRELPVDGVAAANVGKSVSYSDADNTIRVSADFMPEGAVPQTVEYTVSSSGGFGKLTGAFGYGSALGYYQSSDTAVFTDSSSVTLMWFVPAQAKNYIAQDGEFMLGYWWSEQPSVTLDMIKVRYSLGGSTASASTEPATSAPVPDENSVDFRTASQIAGAIKVGWNLGNTLESYNTAKTGTATETGWGNPKTTRDMITSVKNAGFNAVRIPVTWAEHMDGDTIQTEWLDRVQEVVDYAYGQDMFVILNMHHDDYIWFTPSESQYTADSARLKAIWSQISERFKDYGDTLLFEGMNETRTIGSANEWMGGTAEERAVVNKYEQDFVDTVRASGGNNAYRTLVVTSYAASAETVAVNDLVVPNSGNIIVSIHFYAPWQFSEGTVTTFDDSGRSELDSKFAELKSKFADNGTPVIIDEFGCVNAADEATRAAYFEYYVSAAKKQGIKCFVWDNGVSSGEASYGIFDRTTLTWNNALLNAIMNGAK